MISVRNRSNKNTIYGARNLNKNTIFRVRWTASNWVMTWNHWQCALNGGACQWWGVRLFPEEWNEPPKTVGVQARFEVESCGELFRIQTPFVFIENLMLIDEVSQYEGVIAISERRPRWISIRILPSKQTESLELELLLIDNHRTNSCLIICNLNSIIP